MSLIYIFMLYDVYPKTVSPSSLNGQPLSLAIAPRPPTRCFHSLELGTAWSRRLNRFIQIAPDNGKKSTFFLKETTHLGDFTKAPAIQNLHQWLQHGNSIKCCEVSLWKQAPLSIASCQQHKVACYRNVGGHFMKSHPFRKRAQPQHELQHGHWTLNSSKGNGWIWRHAHRQTARA